MIAHSPEIASKRFIGTPTAVAALAAALLTAVVGLSALMVWQNYNAALRAGEARAQAAAHVVAAHTSWMIEASNQALRRMDSALGNRPINSAEDTIANIEEAVGDLPRGFQYSVYDENGRLRFSSIPQAVGISVADREYFQRVRAGEQIVISSQLEERLSGQIVFVIARPIVRNSVFMGAVSIAIPIATMGQFWRSMELGPHSSVSVIRSDGWLVARYPPVDKTMNLSGAPIFTRLAHSPSGTYHSTASPADGISRIVGYWQIEGSPLVAVSGVERNEALGSFWRVVAAQLAVGIPVLALLIAGSVWIARLLRAEAIKTRALQEAAERNRFLLREIHHRVKNNLQTVSSLLRLQPLPEDRRADMSRRIDAMVAIHEQIYQSDQYERVAIAPYVERLIDEIRAAYNPDVEIGFSLEDVKVERDAALPIGLIVNEVVSNAFKHALADRSDGRLEVELKRLENGKARLVIIDNGPGYEPSAHSRGMGTKLISGFASQLRAQLSMKTTDGTRFELTFDSARPAENAVS